MPVAIKLEQTHNTACLTFAHKFEDSDLDYTVFYKRKFFQTRTLKVCDNGVYIDELCNELLKLYGVTDHKIVFVNDDENACILEYTISDQFVSCFPRSNFCTNNPDYRYIQRLLSVCRWVEYICKKECESVKYFTIDNSDSLIEHIDLSF